MINLRIELTDAGELQMAFANRGSSQLKNHVAETLRAIDTELGRRASVGDWYHPNYTHQGFAGHRYNE